MINRETEPETERTEREGVGLLLATALAAPKLFHSVSAPQPTNQEFLFACRHVAINYR